MKYIQLVQKYKMKTMLPIIILFTMLSISLVAKPTDVSGPRKDITIMSRIIETSLEASAKSFPGRVKVNGVYLARQGYLFNIQLNGISSLGIPGVAWWDSGRLELDIPEIIHESLAGVDYGEYFDPDVDNTIIKIVEPVIDSLDGIYENEELKETLKDLRESQREIRHETYQLRRDIRKSENQEKRKILEQKLDKKRDLLKQHSEEYSNQLNTYKNQRHQRQIKKSNEAISSIFSTLCDYGQSLKALKKNEHFSLMIKGGVDNTGKKATQVFVIEQKSLKQCKDSNKLQKDAIYYTL